MLGGTLCGRFLLSMGAMGVVALLVPAAAETRPATTRCGVKYVDSDHTLAASGCWIGVGAVWRSNGPVVVDGLRLRGYPIEVDQTHDTIRSQGPMRWSLGRVVLGRAPFGWSPGQLLTINPSGQLRGLSFLGAATVTFSPRLGGSVAIRARVSLPLFAGGITADVVLRASRFQTFKIHAVKITVPQARLGRLGFQEVSLAYSRPRAGVNRWAGHAQLSLPIFRAPPARTIEAAVRLENRVLKRIAVTLKNLDLDLGEGFFLDDIGIAVVPKPLAVGGDVVASFGPGEARLLNVHGKLIYSRTPERWIASGTVALAHNLIALFKPKLAGAQVTVNPGRSIKVTGKTGLTVHGWGLRAGMSGFVSTDAFNFEGSAKLSLPGPDLHGNALLSSSGLAACLGINLLFHSVHIGFGYRWGGSLNFMHSSCDVGPWRTVVNPLADRRMQTRTQQTIFLPEPQRFEVFAATGGNIRVTTPTGVVYTTTRDTNTSTMFVTHDLATGTAYLIIPEPVAGNYAIEPLTTRPVVVRASNPIPEPIISAAISGTGTTRTLDYSVDLLGVPAETIEFFESTSASIIGATPVIKVDTSSAGSVEFAPEPLGPLARYIWAVVSVDGVIREAEVVAKFSFGPVPPLPAPFATITTTTASATITWKEPAIAAAWELVLDQSDGSRTLQTLRGKTQRIQIPNKTGSKQWSIRAQLTPIDRWGRPGGSVLCDSAQGTSCQPISKD
jgi:hypothetical protein